jgi:hypothetical protein
LRGQILEITAPDGRAEAVWATSGLTACTSEGFSSCHGLFASSATQIPDCL